MTFVLLFANRVVLDDSAKILTFVVTFKVLGLSVTANVILLSVTFSFLRLIVSIPCDTCRDTLHSNKIPTTRLHLRKDTKCA